MSEIVKVCKKHGELTKENIKSGIYKNKKYKKCKFCELERSRSYHEKKYADKEWVELKHSKDKKYWKENKEAITAKRSLPEAKEKRRANYSRWNSLYREKCRIKQQKYRNDLEDSYIRKVLVGDSQFLKWKDIPEDILELKRAIMTANRKLKEEKLKSLEKKLYEDKK